MNEDCRFSCRRRKLHGTCDGNLPAPHPLEQSQRPYESRLSICHLHPSHDNRLSHHPTADDRLHVRWIARSAICEDRVARELPSLLLFSNTAMCAITALLLVFVPDPSERTETMLVRLVQDGAPLPTRWLVCDRRVLDRRRRARLWTLDRRRSCCPADFHSARRSTRTRLRTRSGLHGLHATKNGADVDARRWRTRRCSLVIAGVDDATCALSGVCRFFAQPSRQGRLRTLQG